MNIFFLPSLLFFLNFSFVFCADFEPLSKKDLYIRSNYELLNNFYRNSSADNNVFMKEFIEKFVSNYSHMLKNDFKGDVYYERYMSRLALFFVNMFYSYHKNDTISIEEILRKGGNIQGIVDCAKELYFLYRNNFIKGAEIAFNETITIDDLNKLELNGDNGIDVVYRNKDVLNNHLISMIFFKLLKSNPNDLISSRALGISLPVHIWFKLIFADQKTKMLVFKDDYKERSLYDPQIIIDNLFEHDRFDKEEKLNQLLKSFFSFSIEDFKTIENSFFEAVKNIEDFRNFNKKNHFFLFGEINHSNSDKNKSLLLVKIYDKIISKDECNYYNFLSKMDLITQFNSINSLDTNEKDRIINVVGGNYVDAIFSLFKDIHFYDKSINQILNKSYSTSADIYGKVLKEKFNDLWLIFKSKYALTIDQKKILELLENKDDLFHIKIEGITKSLEKDLKNDFLNIYHEFIKKLDYKSVENIKIVDFEFSFSADFEKIRSHRYNIEIYKILFLKLVKAKVITLKDSMEEIIEKIKNQANVKINNESINFFDKHNIYLRNIDNITYKTRNKKLSGIDVFIFNEFLRDIFMKIFFMSNNRGAFQKIIAKSERLNIQLRYFQWYLLLQSIDKKPLEDKKLVDDVFSQIIKGYENIDQFIQYNNQHCFLDGYIFDDKKTSLREKLFRYYLYKESKDLIDDLRPENTEIKEKIKNNFYAFLSKLKYDAKVLNSTCLSLLKQQDKILVDDYFAEISHAKKQQNYTIINKKSQKNKQKPKPKPKQKLRSSQKSSDPGAQKNKIGAPPSAEVKKLNKKESKKTISQSKSKKENPNKNTQNPGQTIKKEKELEKKQEKEPGNSLAESFQFLKYKLTGEKSKFLQGFKSQAPVSQTQEPISPIQQSNDDALEPSAVTQTQECIPEIQQNNGDVSEQLSVNVAGRENHNKKPGKVKRKVRKFIKDVKRGKKISQQLFNGNIASIPLPSIFYSERDFHKLRENHTRYLKDKNKDKEEYAKIAKEISFNFHCNILALDEFISILLYGSSFQEYEERNGLVSEAWQMMQHILNSPLNEKKDLSNLAQQISNSFYALDSYYSDFINFIYANSSYYNFASSLLNVDETIDEDILANLLTWADSEIKYKKTLSDLALSINNTYNDIIHCRKELKGKLVSINEENLP